MHVCIYTVFLALTYACVYIYCILSPNICMCVYILYSCLILIHHVLTVNETLLESHPAGLQLAQL